MTLEEAKRSALTDAVAALTNACPKTVYVVCGPHLTKMEVGEIKVILTTPPINPDDGEVGVVLVERPRSGTTPCHRDLKSVTLDMSEAINKWEGNA